MIHTCQLCEAEVPHDRYVCAGCETAAAADLATIATLAAAGLAVVARQARHGTGPAVRAVGDPLPLDLAASDTLAAVRSQVTTWARHVAETRGLTPGTAARVEGPLCARWDCGHRSCAARRLWALAGHGDSLVAASGWLTRHLGWLAHRREADEALSGLREARRSLQRLVDAPARRHYLGPCGEPTEDGECPGELWARAGADEVRCVACRAVHDVAARRAWLDGLVATGLYCARDIQDAYGIAASKIRTWAARGRLAPRGRDRLGRRLWPLGEVRELDARRRMA